MLKVTYFGTTSLLFDDGKDQILFDAHVTRPSLVEYFRGARVSTNIPLCDELIQLHHIDRLRAVFISHTHHDHVMDAPYIANQCKAAIYGSESAFRSAKMGQKSRKKRFLSHCSRVKNRMRPGQKRH